jgi:hypothetical protein
VWLAVTTIAPYGGRRSDVFEGFKRALARVQTDYEFYIQCQSNPAVALAGYDLTPDERAALSDPEKLATVLERDIGGHRLAIKVTISGTHDWVNRVIAVDAPTKDDAARHAKVTTEINAIKQARTDDKRTRAVARLMEQIG